MESRIPIPILPDSFSLNNVPAKILIDDSEDSAVRIAAANLSKDFGRVCGIDAIITPVSPMSGVLS